jgi:DNA invertase Pin-like site-specific DNA recombinase
MAKPSIEDVKTVVAAIYSRISTSDHSQDLNLQTNELKEYCARRGWACIEYSDTCSGTKDKRPGLDKMMKDANQYRFQAVVVWKFDRMARSVSHLINTLVIFNDRGIRFISLTQDLDTGTSTGKLLYGLLALIAEFEGDLCRERIRAGLRNAKLKGRRPGPTGPRIDIDMADVNCRIAAGESQRQIAATLGISPALLCKRRKAMQLPSNTMEVSHVAQAQ